MSRYSKINKVAKTGAVDSKYFSNYEQFDKDIETNIAKTNDFKEDLRQLIIKEPYLVEQRVSDAIEVLKEIKKEFEIR